MFYGWAPTHFLRPLWHMGSWHINFLPSFFFGRGHNPKPKITTPIPSFLTTQVEISYCSPKDGEQRNVAYNLQHGFSILSAPVENENYDFRDIFSRRRIIIGCNRVLGTIWALFVIFFRDAVHSRIQEEQNFRNAMHCIALRRHRPCQDTVGELGMVLGGWGLFRPVFSFFFGDRERSELCPPPPRETVVGAKK